MRLGEKRFRDWFGGERPAWTQAWRQWVWLASLHAGLAAAQASSPSHTAAALTVEYRDKPPYSYTDNGRPAGFLLERTQRVMERAGIAARYTEVPVRRTLLQLQADAGRLCSPGLYKLPEREAYARFSLPIHRDRPHVVLAHASVADRIRALPRVAQLFADPQLQAGRVDGVSYGKSLDHALATAAKAPLHAQLSPMQLARMVSVRRVDYMLIDEEDLAWLRKDPDFNGLPLVRVEFPDMPRGELRYIACSAQVPPALLDRINQAIRELLPDLHAD